MFKYQHPSQHFLGPMSAPQPLAVPLTLGYPLGEGVHIGTTWSLWENVTRQESCSTGWHTSLSLWDPAIL